MKKNKLLEKKHAEVKAKVDEYMRASPDHKLPVSRRDFLRIGAINFAAYAAAPSLMTFLAKMGVAEAAECVAATTNPNLAPFFSINMSGGWSLAGNWVPNTIANAPLADYRTLGTAGATAPAGVVTAFANNARFYATSSTVGFLAGVRSITGATNALNRAVFVGIPSVSRDDTDNNRMDPAGLVARAGMVGTALPPLGIARTRTGVGQYAALGINPPPPLRVENLTSVQQALSFVNTNIGALNATQQQSLMRTIKNLSEKQALQLSSLSGGTELSDLISCATGKNITNLTANLANTTNPAGNANYNALWPAVNAQSVLVYNVLQGLSGAGGIELGGFDYHGGIGDGIATFQERRNRQHGKDFESGQLVGRILASAQVLNKKAFIALLSDGSVSAGADNGNNYTAFTSDSGDRGCLGFIAFDPAAAPTTSSQQVGGFTNSGVVDRTTVTGSDVESASVAIFANWARFSRDMRLFSTALPNNTRFDTAFLNQVVKIG